MSAHLSDPSPEAPAASVDSPPAGSVTTSIGIIRNNVMLSMAAGLVPIPFVDIAGVTASQLKMISELADHYKVSFDPERGKSVIAALFTTVGTLGLARGILGSAIKAIPVIGTIGGIAVVPVMSGAATYALGKVFAAHFESGGTLLNFDAGSAKAEFAEQLKIGQEVALDLKDKVTSRIKKKK